MAGGGAGLGRVTSVPAEELAACVARLRRDEAARAPGGAMLGPAAAARRLANVLAGLKGMTGQEGALRAMVEAGALEAPTGTGTPMEEVLLEHIAVAIGRCGKGGWDDAERSAATAFLRAVARYAQRRQARVACIRALASCGELPDDILAESLSDVERDVRTAALAATTSLTPPLAAACRLADGDDAARAHRAFATALCREAAQLAPQPWSAQVQRTRDAPNLPPALAKGFLEALFPAELPDPRASVQALHRLLVAYHDVTRAHARVRGDADSLVTAVREVAAALVAHRLQSHWGNAGQTLTTLESRLRALASCALRNDPLQARSTHLHACTDFFDSLERAAGVALTGRLADARACHFFRANDAVFRDFIARSRGLRAAVASAAGAMPAAAQLQLLRFVDACDTEAETARERERESARAKAKARQHKGGKHKGGKDADATSAQPMTVLSRPVLLRRSDTNETTAAPAPMVSAPTPALAQAHADDSADASLPSIWAASANALAEAGDFDGLDGLARYTENRMAFDRDRAGPLAALARAASEHVSGACATAELAAAAKALSDVAPAAAELAHRLHRASHAVAEGWPGEDAHVAIPSSAPAAVWHAAPLDNGFSRMAAAEVCAWRCALALKEFSATAPIEAVFDDKPIAAGVEPLASTLRVLLAAPSEKGDGVCRDLLRLPSLGDACLSLARAARRAHDTDLARSALDAAAARGAHLAPAVSYERAKLRQLEVPLAGRQTVTALAAGAHIDKSVLAMPLDHLAVESASAGQSAVADEVAGVSARAWLRLSRWSTPDVNAGGDSPLEVAERACRTCPLLAKAWRAHARLSFDAAKGRGHAAAAAAAAAAAHRRAAAISYAAYLALAPSEGGGASADASAAEACLRLLELVVGASSDAAAANAAAEHVLRLPMPAAPWSRVIPQLFARARHVPSDGAAMAALRRIFRAVAQYDLSSTVYAVIRATSSDVADGGARSAFADWAAEDLTSDASGEAALASARRLACAMDSLASFADERARAAVKRVLAEAERRLETDGASEARLASLASRLRALVPDPPHSVRDQRFIASYGEAIAASAASFDLSDSDAATRLAPLRALALSLGVRPSTRQAAGDAMTSGSDQAPVVLRRTPSVSSTRSLDDAPESLHDDGARAYFQNDVVRMEEVHPSLLDWDVHIGAGAPMPAAGTAHGHGTTLTVSGIAPVLTILQHAKTRPRKLLLTGSDGVARAFLLKGNEDLRLDERISHFFAVAQTVLDGDRHARRRGLAVRRYGVVPLGAKFGLLEWAGDRAEPLYQLFQSWQARQREHARHEGSVPPAVALSRPNERFFHVVAPMLQRHLGASVPALPRAEWPADVLDSAYRALAAEAPHDLLVHALAEDAANAADWCLRIAALARSTGASAAFSYAIGLGDRHLSNVLYDRRTSELVQIDYNVCFDQDWNLAFPEVVPCRLSPIFVRSLGPLGADAGAFRAALTHALRASRIRAGLLADTLRGSFEPDPLPSLSKCKGDGVPDAPTMLESAAAKLAGSTPHPWDGDGRVPAAEDDGARADWLVHLSTDPRRLARMFEGWSAWV